MAVVVVIGLVANLAVWFWPRGAAPEDAGGLPTYPSELVARGERAFEVTCAGCHGSAGGGDAAAGIPALDGSMHAWHHPDSQIADLIRNGGGRMPAVGSQWSDEDIAAVLAYIKQWWAPEQRAYQLEASRANP